MNRRVLFLSAVPFFKGGAEKALISFLKNPDISQELVVPSEGALADSARALGFPVHVVDYGQVLNIRRPFKISSVFCVFRDAWVAARVIRKIARDGKFHYIHANGLKVHALACLAKLMGGVKIICHIHDIPATVQEKIFWFFVSKIADKIILVSRYCWYGATIPKNATIVINGIEIHNTALPLAHAQNTLRIGFIGRIHPNKGLHLLAQWLVELKKNNTIPFKLFVRGEAAAEQANYLAAIKQTMKDGGYYDDCVFEGRVEKYEDIYKNIDIVVMPSVVDEPFGLVAIESFERGVPCIAYPSGALPDIIQNGRNGYLCKTIPEFMAALTTLQNPEIYQSIRKQALKDVQALYSIDQLYKTLNSVYA